MPRAFAVPLHFVLSVPKAFLVCDFREHEDRQSTRTRLHFWWRRRNRFLFFGFYLNANYGIGHFEMPLAGKEKKCDLCDVPRNGLLTDVKLHIKTSSPSRGNISQNLRRDFGHH